MTEGRCYECGRGGITTSGLCERCSMAGSFITALRENRHGLETEVAKAAGGRTDAPAVVRRVFWRWLEMYPVDVFRPPLPGQHGDTVDACSAAAIRAVLPRLLDEVLEELGRATVTVRAPSARARSGTRRTTSSSTSPGAGTGAGCVHRRAVIGTLGRRGRRGRPRRRREAGYDA